MKRIMELIAAEKMNRMTRRAYLKQGGLGVAGVSLPRLLQAEQARSSASDPGTQAKNCIFIFLCGGPAHLDLWDLKPEAPDGIRGVFDPIETRVPGIRIGELLPQVSGHTDKLAIIRSMTHANNGHGGAIVHTLHGQIPVRPAELYAARDDHPGWGGNLHRLFGPTGSLPPWVILPRPFTTYSPPYKGQSAGFLGPVYDPFVLNKEAKNSLLDTDLPIEALALSDGVDGQRLDRRYALLQRVDSPDTSERLPDSGQQLQEYYEKAFSMLSSTDANRAFDVTRESETLRDQYGRNEYGQSFLLARRLVEAGVRVVNVFWTFFDKKGCQFNLWDNHGSAKEFCGSGGALKGVEMLKHDYCAPSFDRAFSTLLEDLQQRGLLEETLVAVTGEFGRTPKINANAGRDHWAPCYSQILAGGGVQGGQVFGASDHQGAYVKDRPVTPNDFAATIYHAFGLSPETTVSDALGRPVRISDGSPVTALF
ncbi:MAG: DUF1501 domain-containing protein [Planctomycetes bacterium]|nr:DUF1501 domain-containing protein [Planctomycetota bacterium]